MDIKNSHTLTKAIEEVAPFCAGWALTDKVGDIRHMAQARFRSLMYKEFDIPKRSGGTRRITAPTGKLKDIQRCISAIVAQYYRTPECVHGFAEGRYVATNARNHTGRN